MQDEEADALSNEVFTGFDMAKRISIDPAGIAWRVLPSTVVYGTDPQSHATEAKEKVLTTTTFSQPGKKRETGFGLKQLDPW